MRITLQSSSSGYAGPNVFAEKSIAGDRLKLKKVIEELVIPVLLAYGYQKEEIEDYINQATL